MQVDGAKRPGASEQETRSMGWKQLEFKERFSLATAGIQALATLGMFIVAVVGFWQVTPIIAYQVQQQESELTRMVAEADTDPFVADALTWWNDQLRGYRQVAVLTRESGQQGGEVSFEVLTGAGIALAPGVHPDLLRVTAVDSAGKREVVAVPVNEKAMSPSQYVRFRVNQGAFADRPDDERRRLEMAVEQYINRVMVPVVPPIVVRSDMSVKELQLEVTMNEHHREEALRHLKGLEEVLATARRPQ